MFKVGVTGGIGSGKTLVCKVFEVLGIPVYNADERARALIETHPALIQGYRQLLGPNVYLKNGKLNRALVASKIFSDAGLLQKVNNLVHPVVQDDFLTWSRQQVSPFVIEEAAVLLESGAHHHLDRVIVVSAPRKLRIERVVARDGVSSAEVEKRMAKQWSDSRRLALSHHRIVNDDKQLVLPQILKVYNNIVAAKSRE